MGCPSPWNCPPPLPATSTYLRGCFQSLPAQPGTQALACVPLSLPRQGEDKLHTALQVLRRVDATVAVRVPVPSEHTVQRVPLPPDLPWVCLGSYYLLSPPYQ